MMRRRDFIATVGGAAAMWPFAARAEQRGMPVVGMIRGWGSVGENSHLMAAFHQGLRETGHVENQNVIVEYRYTDGNNDRLPALLSDLIGRQVAVIAVPGNTAAAVAAKAATQTVPVVFMIGGDPVELGLVASIARPGGNLTGVAQLMVPVIAKRLELLHQLVPSAPAIALLLNPTNPLSEAERREVQAAANALKLDVNTLYAQTEDEIKLSFSTLRAQSAQALLLGADIFLLNRRAQIAELAIRYAIPTISNYRDYADAGGLISYGNNLIEANRLTGVYVGRILAGEKPGNLPVSQPTKFDFVINVKTAKALGLAIPDKLLALADEVIE